MLRFAPWVLCALAIGILSLINPPEFPVGGFKFQDKVLHAIAYAALSACAMFALWKKNGKKIAGRTPEFISIASCSMYGVLIECLQYSLTRNRYFEISDILANIVGCLFGVFLYKVIFKSFIS